MKNYILISDGKTYSFDSMNELKYKLFLDYDKKTKDEQKEYFYEKVFGFCVMNDLQIIDSKVGVYKDNYKINQYEKKNMSKAIIIDNIDTYILSLCKFNIITILEEKDNRFYTKNINIDFGNNNYVIVNSFADELLSEMVGDI